MKIAIIGAGISGLGAAYLLNPHHDITVYEKNNYPGGHSRTIHVPTGNIMTPVDTGFIVFNDWNYPNLMGLFDRLGVVYEKSDMSFGVSIDRGWLEYSSNNMFAQSKNILRPAYWGMIFNILRFNKQALDFIDQDPSITLGDCLERLRMGEWFQRYYLLAMGAAIWSCSTSTILQFPAQTFLQFFKNHGLLSVNNRPQWYTVSGGSAEYVSRLSESFQDKIRLNCGAEKIIRDGENVYVHDTQGGIESYDEVVFACHGDEALAMIQNPRDQERAVLENFTYQENRITVHRDLSFMPRNKKCWASWVYLSEGREDEKPVVSLSYWMNNLQNLDLAYPIIVTLNPGRRPRRDLILDEHVFSHPVFDRGAIGAQSQIETIQGQNKLWFCGAYQRYGFHEDGLLSAVKLAKKLGAAIPWE